MTWLPMNITPKDGTTILVVLRHHNAIRAVSWYSGWVDRDGNEYDDDEICGWRPLSFIPVSACPPPEGRDIVITFEAGDPYILCWCKGGGYWMSLNDNVWRYTELARSSAHWALVPETEAASGSENQG